MNTFDNDYRYSFLKHDNTGSTFYTKYFHKNGVDYSKLELSLEEFLESVSLLIGNLETIDGIRDILDIELLKETIFGSLEMKDSFLLKK